MITLKRDKTSGQSIFDKSYDYYSDAIEKKRQKIPIIGIFSDEKDKMGIPSKISSIAEGLEHNATSIKVPGVYTLNQSGVDTYTSVEP